MNKSKKRNLHTPTVSLPHKPPNLKEKSHIKLPYLKIQEKTPFIHPSIRPPIHSSLPPFSSQRKKKKHTHTHTLPLSHDSTPITKFTQNFKNPILFLSFGFQYFETSGSFAFSFLAFSLMRDFIAFHPSFLCIS